MAGLRGLSGSPDGRYLAAAGYSSDTLLIFGGGGALLPEALASHCAAAPLDGICAAAFAPLSPGVGVYLLATASKNSSSLILWKLEAEAGGPAQLQPLEVRSVHSFPALEGAAALAFSPDGRHLYCAGEDSGIISIWSAPTAEGDQGLSLVAEVSPPPACEGPADITISPDGLWAATAYKSGDSLCIFRRSPSDGQLTAHSTFTDESGRIDQLNGVHRVDFAAAANPAGLHLYSSSYYDDAVCLFTLANSAVWSYEGSWKEFGSVQEPAPAFSTGPAAEYRADIGRLNYTQALAVSPAGDLLAVAAGGNDTLCLWSRNPADGSLSPLAAIREGLEGTDGLPLPGFAGPLSGLDGARSVLWSPEGRRLYCAASNSNALTVLEQW
jgi:WD40 repeat protein